MIFWIPKHFQGCWKFRNWNRIENENRIEIISPKQQTSCLYQNLEFVLGHLRRISRSTMTSRPHRKFWCTRSKCLSYVHYIFRTFQLNESHSIVINRSVWSNGYDVRFTRERFPVRSWALIFFVCFLKIDQWPLWRTSHEGGRRKNWRARCHRASLRTCFYID